MDSELKPQRLLEHARAYCEYRGKVEHDTNAPSWQWASDILRLMLRQLLIESGASFSDNPKRKKKL